MNLVRAFETIRDIPYDIPLTADGKDHCCAGKTRMLLDAFRDMGYEARVRMCEFRWSDLELPKSVNLVPHDDACTHVFAEVRIHDDWIAVDPSWDKGLASVLPVAEWNGVLSTRIAVPATTFFSAEESERRFF